MLKQRLVTALILAALLAWILLTQGLLAWQGFLLLVAALAAEEWAGLAIRRRALRLGYAVLTALAAAWLLRLPGAGGQFDQGLLLLATLFWAAVVPIWLARGWRLGSGLPFLLVGWLLILPTALALLALRQRGVLVLLACMAVIWVSDISAYFAGRAFGRRRLAPSISPGKTWEGVAGALLGVGLFGVLLAQFGGRDPGLSAILVAAGGAWWPILAVLVALGIEGDLFESWLKRCAGVKDSGWILPGHGGVLDRIDALTAALPVAALLLGLTGGGHPG